MGLCECGCGGEAKPGNRFITGHNSKVNNSNSGKHFTEESKQKMSEAKRISREIREGIRPPPEPKLCKCGCGQLCKIGNTYINGHSGKCPCSEEAKQKISDAKRGKPSNRKGKHHTEEAKQKISKSNTGKHHTEEHRRKNSEGHKGIIPWIKGKHHTPETKQLLKEINLGKSSAMKGKHHTEESKKKMSESLKGKNLGENHHNWKGGISNFPYCEKFDENFKERVRIFFDRCCYICGKNEIDNGEKLSVHHVTYNKNTCCDDSKPLFVPLCHSCHSKTHYDREHWEEFFTVSLEYLTDGKCFYTKVKTEELAK